MIEQFRQFNQALEQWFSEYQRDFPWRKTSDPYAILISEIMSHQTQINRVAEHFWPKFMERFPTLDDLAMSKWEDVFPYWDGLGYYYRGQNLIRTAQILRDEYDGIFPDSEVELEKLPGIGKYTAAALLAFAFDRKVPAVDTNISRIIASIWPDKNLLNTAQTLVELSNSGAIWNGAMMDLASYLRLGKVPDGKLGDFFGEEVRERFFTKPENRKKTSKNKPGKNITNAKVKTIEVGIACIWKDGKYLVQSRPEGKTFMGYWEFPGGKREKGEDFRACVKREIEEEIGVKVSVRPHFYEEQCQFKNTHLLLRFHRAQIQQGEPRALEGQQLDWVAPDDFFKRKFLPTNHEALKILQKMRL